MSDSWGATWIRAFCSELERRFDSAIRAYDDLVLIDRATIGGLHLGSKLQLLLRRGALQLRVAQFERARLDFARAQMLADQFMEPDLLLGKSYLMEEDGDASRRIFEELHARRRGRGDSALWIAALYASHHRLDSALDWARRIPDDDSRLRMMAPLLASLERFDEAAASYRELLTRSPRDAEVHIGLARVLVEQLGGVTGVTAMAPELTEVFRLLGRARELVPENPLPYNLLGMLHHALGENDRARELFDLATRKGRQQSEKRLMNRNHNRRIDLAAVLTLTLGVTASGHEGSWEDVRPVTELNGFSGEYESALSPDGLEMYFGRCCTDGFGGADIWIATRESLDEPFGDARNAGQPINSSAIDNPSCLSEDGLELYMFSGRPLQSSRGRNIFVARRDAPGQAFSEPTPIVELNTDFDDYHVTLAPGGLEMVFDSFRPGGGGGGQDLWLASRPDKASAWEVVGPLSNLNTPDWDRAAIFSSDGGTLFFDRWVGPNGSGRLWCATRNQDTGLFDNPRRFEGPVNDAGWNGNSNISPFWPADGSELFWTRCFGENNCDMYVANWRAADTSRFLRGDCNDDGDVNLSDATCTLDRLFAAADGPDCVAALNVNGDAAVDLADPVSLLNFLFAGGPAPVDPFPVCGAGQLSADEELGCVTPPDC